MSGVRSIMYPILVLLLMNIHKAAAVCDAGWVNSTSYCYKLIDGGSDFNSVVEARGACGSDAEIAMFPDSSDQAVVEGLATSGKAYVGIMDPSIGSNAENSFMWIATSSEINPNFMTNTDGTNEINDCAYIEFTTGNAVYHEVSCSFPEAISKVVCMKFQTGTYVKPPGTILEQYTNTDCPTDWYKFNNATGGFCMQVFSGSNINTTYDARQLCQTHHADIPRIDAKAKEMFMDKVLATQGSITSVYIGVNRISAENIWFTNNDVQSTADTGYDNWNGDEPNAGGKCVKVETTDNWATLANSKWYNVSCCEPVGISKVICEKPAGIAVNILPDNDVFAEECYANINECITDPCLAANATCIDRLTYRECQCDYGYEGDYCNELINFCESTAPCQNNGTCHHDPPGYYCDCLYGYNDTNCDNLYDHCVITDCMFNGTCITVPNSFICQCPEGITGQYCETNLNDCENITCDHGECVDMIGYHYCACEVGFTGSLCESAITCQDTATVGNSTHDATSGPYAFNAEMVYTCIENYKFDDMETVKTMVCSDMNTWTPNIGDCEEHCASIPEFPDGAPINPNTAIGHTLFYKCNIGYRFVDNGTTHNTTCQEGRTWDNDVSDFPACEIITCPQLPYHDNQYVNKRNNTYGTTIVFWCEVGYSFMDMTTARSIQCKGDGQWTAELPPCEPVMCPPIPMIDWGDRTSEERSYGTVVEYTCNSGYRMWDGAAWKMLRCDATGEWSNTVTDCAVERCFPLPYVGKATPHTYNATWGSIVTFTCDIGHRFVQDNGMTTESKTMTCLETSRWDPILTECLPIECPNLFNIVSSMNLENISPSSEERLYESKVRLECARGHYLSDNSSYIALECLENEQWNVSQVLFESCTPVQCLEPPEPDERGNRETIAEGTQFFYLDSIHYNCQEGNKYVDGLRERDLICNEFGIWNQLDVSCRSDRCDPVPLEANVVSNTTATAWDTVVGYTCAEGHEWSIPINPTYKAVCTNEGSWASPHGNLVPCNPKVCPDPTDVEMPFSTFNNSKSTYVFDDEITYTCDHGYKYADDTFEKTTRCNKDGVWQPALSAMPHCQPVQCPTLPDAVVENATMTSNDTSFGSVVQFPCLEGYQYGDKIKIKSIECISFERALRGHWDWFGFELRGSQHLDHQKHGNFCDVVYCQPVPTHRDMYFNSTLNDFYSIIEYTCMDGYIFDFSGDNAIYETSADVHDFAYDSAFFDEILGSPVVEESTASANGEVETTSSRMYINSQCNDNKEWYPPIIDCKAEKSIGADLVGVTYDAAGAATFGAFAITLLSLIGVVIVLLDLNKIWMDITIMRANVRDMMDRRKKNKVSDSRATIRMSTPNIAESSA